MILLKSVDPETRELARLMLTHLLVQAEIEYRQGKLDGIPMGK